MPSVNVCKSNQRRDRNQAKLDAAGKVHTTEDRRKHEAAQNAIQCTVCLAGFGATVGLKELQTHMENRHPKAPKTFQEMFPKYTGPAPTTAAAA